MTFGGLVVAEEGKKKRDGPPWGRGQAVTVEAVGRTTKLTTLFYLSMEFQWAALQDR